MRMICSTVFPDFIRHTPICTVFKQLQLRFDCIMIKTLFNRIVYSNQPLTTPNIIFHIVSFLSLVTKVKNSCDKRFVVSNPCKHWVSKNFVTVTEVGGNTNPDFPTLHKQFTHRRNNIKSVQCYILKYIHLNHTHLPHYPNNANK